MSGHTRIPYKTINYNQWQLLQTKTRSNADHILRFLETILANPTYPNLLSNEYVFECFALFTHAVEEYGKLLYLKSLTQDSNGNVIIEYDKDKKTGSKGLFKDHKYKFNLAVNSLPDSIKVVYEGAFDSNVFDSSDFDIDTIPSWDARLNILNTDIDSDGNPTNITTNVDLDKLRQSVFDFRNLILSDKNKTV